MDDCIKVIDDLVQREVEWADESTEELQDAWDVYQEELDNAGRPL